MPVLLVIFLLFSAELAFANEKKDSCAGKEVCLKITNQKNFTSKIQVINQTPYIVSVKINLEPKSLLAYPKRFPKIFVLNSRQRADIDNIKFKKTKNSISYNTNFSWMYGDYRVSRSNYPYRLPYGFNKSYLVGQSFNGKKTHKNHMNHAVDWNMDIGTYIYAARSGYVINLADNFKESGNDPSYSSKSNYIKILHNDGTSATYAHLNYKGVKVKKGQKVRVGEFIGYSGNTGYSSGPHLHMHVAVPQFTDKGVREKTIPFSFSNCNYQNFIPKISEKYKNC